MAAARAPVMVLADPGDSPGCVAGLMLDGAQDSDGGELRRYWGCR